MFGGISMRCQRCGFEIEPGQTFCRMCGTEQSKALRPDKKKKIKSILGVIKITSNNHLKMWGNFALVLASFLYVLFARKGQYTQLAYLCLLFILLCYVLFQCLVPYKNPNASKSKKYKLGIKVVFILVVLIMILVLFVGSQGLMDLAKSI